MSTTPAEPARPSLAELARRHGLERVGARPGLSDYLRELWRQRYFIWTLARARVRARNQRDVLGSLWTVIQPLLLAGTYLLIFGQLLGTGRSIENFPAYLAIGVFLFQFVSQSVSGGARSIESNAGLVRALQFPRASMPLTTTLQAFLLFLPALLVLLVVVLLTGEPVRPQWLLLPVVLALLTAFNVGLALVLARLVTISHDVLQAIPFTMRIWMYLSGVFWTVDTVSDIPLLRFAFEVNPAYVFIALTRRLLLRESPDSDYNLWALGVGWALVVLVVGAVFFWRGEETYGHKL